MLDTHCTMTLGSGVCIAALLVLLMRLSPSNFYEHLNFPSAPNGLTSSCDFERLEYAAWSQLAPHAFDSQYQKLGRPVVFMGIDRVWNASKWSLEDLTSRFGNYKFRFGSAPYPVFDKEFMLFDPLVDNIFQYGQVPVSYILHGPEGECKAEYGIKYSYARPIHENASLACEILRETKLISPIASANVQLAGLIIGGSGKTTLKHRHDSAVNHLLFGKKFWEIWGDNGDLLGACVQNPGDAIFIPNGMDHQVENLEFSIAFQLQFYEGHFGTDVGKAEIHRFVHIP